MNNSNKIEIYKKYIETIENISKRRLTTHTFFLTINLAFLSVLTILLTKQEISDVGKIFLLLSSVIGLLINVCYVMLLYRYRRINKTKYNILLSMEKEMPLKPFHMETKYKTKTLSKWGYLIPIIFMMAFVVSLILVLIYLY